VHTKGGWTLSIAGWVIFGLFVLWCLGFVHRHFAEREPRDRQPTGQQRKHAAGFVRQHLPHRA